MAAGAYGTVHLGKWTLLPGADQTVAIKKIKLLPGEKPKVGGWHKDAEIKLMMRLRHENLVHFFGAGQLSAAAGGELFVVLEYCPGGDLSHLLASPLELSWPQRLAFSLGIARGMEYLHSRRLLHRCVRRACVRVSLSLHTH